jgi:membrane-bound lytic murein transglycosylase A
MQQADHFGSYPVTYDKLSGWDADNHAQALETFKMSCSLLAQSPRGRSSGSGLKIPRDTWISLCADASRIPMGNTEQARVFFEQHFTPYRITNNGKDRGLFTGYYEPVLYGSYKKHGHFIYPLYKRPPDLRDKRSYYTHAEIDHGALAKRKLELLWVDDPVMIFFLQIQGSGLVRLDTGGSVLVGYAGQNNLPYVSLGKIFGDEGLLPKDDVNFFTLRKWLYDHPSQAMAMMERKLMRVQTSYTTTSKIREVAIPLRQTFFKKRGIFQRIH